jgi:hypothetical protein
MHLYSNDFHLELDGLSSKVYKNIVFFVEDFDFFFNLDVATRERRKGKKRTLKTISDKEEKATPSERIKLSEEKKMATMDFITQVDQNG